MRQRLVVITLGLALVGASFASLAAGSARLPTLIVGRWAGIKPTGIDFSGDGGNVVTHLRWKSWTRTRALGSGVSIIQGCVPNCAQGTQKRVFTRITITNPRRGHFTKIVEVRHRQTYVAHYGRPSWPENAS